MVSRIDTIDVIDKCINEVIHECLEQDPVETYMVQKANEQLMEVTKYQPSRWTSRFEPLRKEDDMKDTTLMKKSNWSSSLCHQI